MTKPKLTAHLIALTVAELLQQIGYERIQKSALSILVEFVGRYLTKMCSIAKKGKTSLNDTQMNELDACLIINTEFHPNSLGRRELVSYAQSQIELYNYLARKASLDLNGKKPTLLHLLKLLPEEVALRATNHRRSTLPVDFLPASFDVQGKYFSH